jgi:tyrosyl-tRNA synthetase
MKEGAVKIDGQKVTDPAKDYAFDKPAVLQLGNRRFVRLVQRD